MKPPQTPPLETNPQPLRTPPARHQGPRAPFHRTKSPPSFLRTETALPLRRGGDFHGGKTRAVVLRVTARGNCRRRRSDGGEDAAPPPPPPPTRPTATPLPPVQATAASRRWVPGAPEKRVCWDGWGLGV